MNRKGGRAGPTRFVLCIDSGEYPASLQRRKLYEVRPDADAEAHGQLKIIDDSGGDYLYPRECFQPVELTPFLNRLVRGLGKRAHEALRPLRRPTKVRAQARRGFTGG
jgi:hypothetical protein